MEGKLVWYIVSGCLGVASTLAARLIWRGLNSLGSKDNIQSEPVAAACQCDSKQCQDHEHRLIDLEHRVDENTKDLASADTAFKEIQVHLGSIDKNVAVLLDRSDRVRKGDDDEG